MAEERLDGDKLRETVEKLNKFYGTHVKLEKSSHFTLFWYNCSVDTIYWLDSLHPLPLEEGLSALAHEFAHAVTVFNNAPLLSYNDIDELTKIQFFECIGIQFQELLDQMLCEWWNIDYEEIQKWLAEKRQELCQRTVGRYWLREHEPALNRTIEYFSHGGHGGLFAGYNEDIAKQLGVKPQSLGIEEMEYVYDDVF